MLLLTSPADQLQIVTSAAAIVNAHASWVDTDTSSGTIAPGRTNTSGSTAGTRSTAGSPAAGVQRNVKTLHVRNADATLPCDVTVQHTDGTVAVQLYKRQLQPGDMLEYTDQAGFAWTTAAGTSGGGAGGGGGQWVTGDVRATFKISPDPGWIMANDGSIGNNSSGATTRNNNDTRALFVLLWTNITSLIVQDSVGNTVARSATADADFDANRRLVIPKMLGRVLAGAGAGAGLANHNIGDTTGAETVSQSQSQMAYHLHGGVWSHVNDAGQPQVYVAIDPTGASRYIVSEYYGTQYPAGGGSPMNIMQPTTFVNYMIKL